MATKGTEWNSNALNEKSQMQFSRDAAELKGKNFCYKRSQQMVLLVQLVNTLGGSDWERGEEGARGGSREAGDALLLGLSAVLTVQIMEQPFICPSDCIF